MTNPVRRELSLWADLNSMDAGRRIKASLRFAPSAELPTIAEWIRLHNDEGNAVMGQVEEIEGLVVHARPEMATWSFSELSLDQPFVGPLAFPVDKQQDVVRTQ